MKLSICMMIKNEEKNLKRCLDSLNELRKSIASELIIIDTGSTDNSIEIAKEYTEKVYFHKWDNNFSGMRNKTIGYASGEWVFIIDADEELEDYKPISDILSKKIKEEVGAFAITVKNVTGYGDKHIMSKSPRVFKRRNDFHYEGIVHNMPKFTGQIYELKTSLIHYGYINTDSELMEKKFRRTKALLEKSLEQNPTDIYYRYQLGVSYMMHKDMYDGCNEFSKAYDLLNENNKKEFFYIFIQYAKALLVTKKYDRLLEICEEALEIYPDHMDIHFYYAHGLYELEMYDKSINEFKKYLYLAENYENLPISKNLALVVNTLYSAENANYMLCISNIQLNKNKEIHKYIYKIKDYESIKKLARPYVEYLIEKGDFEEINSYYKFITSNNSTLQNPLIMLIENSLIKKDDVERKRFYTEFNYTNDKYSNYCKIKARISSYLNLSDEIKKEIDQFLINLNVNKDLVIYSDIIYIAITAQLNIFDVTYSMNYKKHIEVMDYLNNKYEDLSKMILDYDFDKNKEIFNIDEFIYRKTKLIWKRTALLGLTSAANEFYIQRFDEYVSLGINFIRYKYGNDFIENEYIDEIIYPEEIFFIYMSKIETLDNHKDKIHYYKKALDIYPGMGKGINIHLKRISSEIEKKNSEKEMLKIELKNNIRGLINKNHLSDAQMLIYEYEQFEENDPDLYSMKAIIFMLENKLEKAEEMLKCGLKIAMNNFDLLFNLAYLYESSERYTEALCLYQLAKQNCIDDSIKEEISQVIFNIENTHINSVSGNHTSPNCKDRILLFGNVASIKEANDKLSNEFYILGYIENGNSTENSADQLLSLNSFKLNEVNKLEFDYIFITAKDINDKENDILSKLNIPKHKIFNYFSSNTNSCIEGLDYKLLKLIQMEKVELAITGLSYAETGINSDLFDKNAINLALSSQDIYYDYALFKYIMNFESVYRNLKHVIINLAYYSFDYDLSRTFERKRIHRYYPFLKDTHNNNNILELKLINHSYHNTYKYEDYQNIKQLKSNILMDTSSIEGGKKYATFHSRMNHPEIAIENASFFEEYLEMLKKHNIKPIIVVCPVSSYYYRHYLDESKERFYNILGRFKDSYEFQLLDYFNSQIFSDSDFWDHSHLNGVGTRKLTKLLQEHIQW